MYLSNVSDDARSIQPSIIKLSRHRHNRSVKNRRHHSRSAKVIHTSIGFRNNARSTTEARHHHQDESRRTSISECSKSVLRTASITRTHRVTPFPSQPSGNILKNDGSKKKLPVQSSYSSAQIENDQEHDRQTIFTAKSKIGTVISPKVNSLIIHKNINDGFHRLETIDTHSARMDTVRDYHQNSKRNKKKKYRRFCIIASVLGILIFSIILLSVLLGVLLKPKATETTATTVITITTTPTTAILNPCITGVYWNITGALYAGSSSSGSALNQLNSPNGIFIDSNDDLYINDGGNCRIVKYLPGTTSGVLVAGSGTNGNAANQISTNARFSYVDSNQNVYIGDTSNHRVVRWAKNVSIGTIVAGNGSFGLALEQVRSPFGVWVDSNSNLFVAESQNHRVTKWAPGAIAGIMVAGGNGSGITTDKLSSPAGLFYDETNQDLYIANSGSNIVMKWHAGALTGVVVAGVAGSSGSTATLLSFPLGLTLDRWNNIYVADRSNSRIQLFCNGNSTGITIAGFFYGGTSLSLPYSVALDSQLNLYVSENGYWRVTKFFKL